MKFIRKHSAGPWYPFYTKPYHIDKVAYDQKLIGCAPEMLDYLIERALSLLSWKENGQLRYGEIEDFERILHIIKKTGVEVVE